MDDLSSALAILAAIFVGRIVLKALWGGWKSNDYKRDE